MLVDTGILQMISMQSRKGIGMVSLYNCKHSGDQYRITKFTSDFDVEASYLCDLHSCECPAGHRPKCRHRDMLPKFIAREAVGSNWFFDHDRGGWVQGWKEEQSIEALDAVMGDNEPSQEEFLASAALPIQPRPEPSSLINDFSELIKYATPEQVTDALGPSPSPTIRRRV